MQNKPANYFLSVLIVTLLLLSLFAFPAFAQEGGGISIDFEESSLPEGWEKTGDVLIANGVMKINPGNGVYYNGSIADLSLSIKIKPGGPGEIMFHYYATPGNGYNLILHPGGMLLDKVYQEQPTMLAEMGREEFLSTDWSTLTISFLNGQHQVTLDGEVILTAQDDDLLYSCA